MKNSRVLALLISIPACALFYLIDQWVKDVSVAPLLGVILMFALSLMFRPSALAVAMVILIPYVIFSLTQTPSFDLQSKESVYRLIVRTCSFGVAGLLAMLASHFRTRTGLMLKQTILLLESLPVPIVLSEPSGLVVWRNEAAQRLCGSAPLVGRRYVEALPFDGRTINYPALFGDRGLDDEMKDAIPGRTLKFIPICGTGRALLATVIFARSADESTNGIDDSLGKR